MTGKAKLFSCFTLNIICLFGCQLSEDDHFNSYISNNYIALKIQSFISVWDMQTGKCVRTFRHRYPIMAVAMSTNICISGCEGGRVKVWNLRSGDLIKVTIRAHNYMFKCH